MFLPFSNGSLAEGLLRNRGRLRHALASYHAGRLRRTLALFLEDKWRPSSTRAVSDYRISLTSWRPRLPDLPLVLLTLLNQTLRPREIVVWLTATDHAAIAEPIRARFTAFGVRFEICADLKCHTKWLPILEEGHRAPFVICDDDIVYPRNWFGALVAEDRPDAYVGAKCHRITLDPKGLIRPYSEWEKQIGPGGPPSHRVFITGVGGAVIHPERIAAEFRDRKGLMESCPRADDIWLKLAHMAAGVPCAKTRYRFPCLELPDTDQTGLAVSNVDRGGNDRQMIAQLNHFGLKYLIVSFNH